MCPTPEPKTRTFQLFVTGMGLFASLSNATDNSARFNPAVTIRAEYATVGCYTVTREAVEKLYSLFQKHFPVNDGREVKIQ